MGTSLDKLTIMGFKSIRELVNFELTNLNVVVGGNGAGKSNLISFFRMMRALIDSVFSESQLPDVGDDRKPKSNPLNANFKKKEFEALWSRINQKAVYRVKFDSSELIQNCVRVLDKELRVAPLQYIIQGGIQRSRDEFALTNLSVETHHASIHSVVAYDLLGKIAENTQLTRKTVAEILSSVQTAVFEQFKQNPEHFIAKSSRLINEQKATTIIERLSYNSIDENHSIDIFTAGQSRQDFTKASEKLKKHIYDYVITESKVEQEFAKELDASTEVVVYAKLPRGFLIPTPVGDYNPDWAISFREGSVKYIYFVAETKGSISSMELRAIEKSKIECARKFFAEINSKINLEHEHVKYDVVTSYGELMEIIGMREANPEL